MKKTTICIFLLLVAGLGAGCKETKEPTAVAPVVEPTVDEMIVANAEIVLAAMELYAEQNGGEYPSNTMSVNLLGNTLVDLLPEGTLLTNEVTGYPTEPVEGSAGNSGEIGFFVQTNSSGANTGYYLNALGEDYSTVFERIKNAVD